MAGSLSGHPFDGQRHPNLGSLLQLGRSWLAGLSGRFHRLLSHFMAEKQEEESGE